MSHPDPYEVYAIRYATSPYRRRFNNCLFCESADLHQAPMPMDFFIWVIRNASRLIVIDTGSRDRTCRERGHEFIRSPLDGLAALGIRPDRVDDVIVTHMHWDHAGNIDRFENAHTHLQVAEMRNVTSPDMGVPAMNRFFHVDDVVTVVRRLFEGRMTFHEGVREIAPGVSVHEVNGHSAGMQVVRVYTRRGWIVLASDAAHFYVTFRENNAFPVMYNYQDMVRGWETCRQLADGPDHIIPGHDPLVLKTYPPVSSTLEGDVVRLDLDPLPQPS